MLVFLLAVAVIVGILIGTAMLLVADGQIKRMDYFGSSIEPNDCPQSVIFNRKHEPQARRQRIGVPMDPRQAAIPMRPRLATHP